MANILRALNRHRLNGPRSASMSPAQSSVALNYQQGDPAPGVTDIAITNGGTGILNAISPAVTFVSGSGYVSASILGSGNAQTLRLTWSVGALAVGAFQANVVLTCGGASNSPLTIPVTVNVSTNTPALSLSATGGFPLSFSGTAGGTSPASQRVSIANTGGGTLAAVTPSVSYGSGSGWLSVVPGGSGNAQYVDVTASPAALAAGSFSATVSLDSPGASNTPQSFSVDFAVASGAGYSPLNSPSTTVYNPRPNNGIAALPSVFMDTRYDPAGTPLTWASDVLLTDTGNAATNTTNLQAEVNACITRVGHSRIRLPDGFTFNRIRLRNKTSGAYWTYIEWDGINTKIAEGTRATAANMVGAPQNIIATNLQQAFYCEANASYYRISGIEVVPGSTSTQVQNAIWFEAADTNGTTPQQTTTAVMPTWMIVDRCYVHVVTGTSAASCGITYGVLLHCSYGAVIDSTVIVYRIGVESHAVGGYNTTGPHKVVGNQLTGSIECFWGGADPPIVNVIPSDLEIRRNWLYKPDSFNKNDATNWDGIASKVMKNNFEIKNGQRWLFEGNLCDGSFADAQTGYAILMKVENSGQTSYAAWMTNLDGTCRYNRIRRCKAGIDLNAWTQGPVTLPGRRWEVYHNLSDQFGDTLYGAGSFNPLTWGHDLQDVLVEHNTSVPSPGFSPNTYLQMKLGAKGPNMTCRNNIGTKGSFGVFGDGSLSPPAPIEGTNTLNTYCPNGYTFTKNIMVGASLANYPAGNLAPANDAAVLYTDQANRNYRLQAGSPGHAAATDGTDIGCNQDDVELAISGV